MGTNYYLMKGICPSCQRAHEELHIGKSSGGWCFSLHVMPEEGIRDLPDWLQLFNEDGAKIRNEYGEDISVEEMIEEITKRKGNTNFDEPRVSYVSFTGLYEDWKEFHARNHSEPGPNGLLRHKILEGHCIGHGEGTWDLILGEFS